MLARFARSGFQSHPLSKNPRSANGWDRWVQIFLLVVGWVGLGQSADGLGHRKWTHGQLWSAVHTDDGELGGGYFGGAGRQHAGVGACVSQLDADDHQSAAADHGVSRRQSGVDVRAAVDHHQLPGIHGAEIPAHLLP